MVWGVGWELGQGCKLGREGSMDGGVVVGRIEEGDRWALEGLSKETGPHLYNLPRNY